MTKLLSLAGATGFASAAFIPGLYNNAVVSAIMVSSAGAGLSVPFIAPLVIGLIPVYLLSCRICDKYEYETTHTFSSEAKGMSAQFLLWSSYFILSKTIGLMFLSAFVASLNPFTLPVLLAAGSSAAVILGLYLLSRPVPENRTIVNRPSEGSSSYCGKFFNFFKNLCPAKQEDAKNKAQLSDERDASRSPLVIN